MKEKSKNHIELELFSNKNHSIFYIIKYPEDHVLNNKRIKSTSNGKKSIHKGWEMDTMDKMYFTETDDSISVTVKPNLQNQIVLLYKFSPAQRIIVLPAIVAAFLTLSSLYLIDLSSCSISSYCIIPDFIKPSDPTLLLNRTIEIGGIIIATSFVLPRLIKNSHIRYKMLKWYFIPVLCAIALLIK